MEASRRPRRGIPRAQAAFQPATSASDRSAARSQHRDSSLPGVTQQSCPTRYSSSSQAMSALGCGVPPPQILLEVEAGLQRSRRLSKVTREPWVGRAGAPSGSCPGAHPPGSSLAKPTTASQSSQDIRQLQFLAPYSLETTMSHSYQGKLRHTAKKSQEGSGVGKERLRIPGGRHSWGVP